MISLNPPIQKSAVFGQTLVGLNRSPQITRPMKPALSFGQTPQTPSKERTKQAKSFFRKNILALIALAVGGVGALGVPFSLSKLPTLEEPALRAMLPLVKQANDSSQTLLTMGNVALTSSEQESFQKTALMLYLGDLWTAHEKALETHDGSHEKAFTNVSRKMFEQLYLVSGSRPEVLERYVQKITQNVKKDALTSRGQDIQKVKNTVELKPLLHEMLDEFLPDADPDTIQAIKTASDQLFNEIDTEVLQKEEKAWKMIYLSMGICLLGMFTFLGLRTSINRDLTKHLKKTTSKQ